VRLAYTYLPAVVRQEIEDAHTPMGRILINHNVLRRVQLSALWRVHPKQELARIFNCDSPRPTYGRTALIYCAGEPALQVLEIMPPGLGD
jgi:chorismate-pyruvate lyase